MSIKFLSLFFSIILLHIPHPSYSLKLDSSKFLLNSKEEKITISFNGIYN